MAMMCSSEPILNVSHTLATTNAASRSTSLKLIEKRLRHLRQELQILAKREQTDHLDQPSDENDDHHLQYEKRLTQLRRSHDKQVSDERLSVYVESFVAFSDE
jgi:hypothetical protein